MTFYFRTIKGNPLYMNVEVAHDNTVIDMGLMDIGEREGLIETLLSAVVDLTDYDFTISSDSEEMLQRITTRVKDIKNEEER